MKNCCLCGVIITSSDGEASTYHCTKCEVYYCERCSLMTATCSICGSAVGIFNDRQ